MNVLSRVRRNLGTLSRFKIIEYGKGEMDSDSSRPIGIYDNSLKDGHPDSISVTDQCLIVLVGSETTILFYDEISRIQGPKRKVVDSTIRITKINGDIFTIDIHGRAGKHQDVFSFTQFLNRVVEDISKFGGNNGDK